MAVPGEERAHDSALRSLSLRPHSAAELRRKLVTKGTDPATADRVIERLKEIDLVNDERFTREYLEYAFVRKMWGRRRVRAGLMERGIDRAIIEEVLGAPEAAEMEQRGAEKFVAKEVSTGRLVREGKQKLASRLLARGFSWDIASRAIGEAEGLDPTT